MNILEKIDKCIKEKWGNEYVTPKNKKGMWKGWSIEKLKKERERLENIVDRSDAESTRLKQVNFALRAKTGWGSVPK